MKNRNLMLGALFLSATLFAPSLHSQVDEWADVKLLPAGSDVVVKTQRKKSCVLETADDQTLTCHTKTRPFAKHSRQLFFDRRDIREVRVIPKTHFHCTAHGLIMGALAGTFMGAVSLVGLLYAPVELVFIGGGALLSCDPPRKPGPIIYRQN